MQISSTVTDRPMVIDRSAVGTTRRYGRCQGALLADQRQQVDRQQVHRVHQEDPDEHRQRQRGHELAALGVVHDALGLGVDHLDQDLDRGLQAARHARGGLARRAPQQPAASTPSTTAKKIESRLKTVKSTTPVCFLFCRCCRWWTMYSPAVGACPACPSAAINASSRFVLSSPPAPQQRDPVHLHAHHQAGQQRRPAQGLHELRREHQHRDRNPILTISHNMKLTALAPGDTLDRRLVMPRAIKAPGTTTVAAP
jgi:hypothetical protein